MIQPRRRTMTIAQLKRSIDGRFRVVDRRFAKIDRGFQAVDRRFRAVESQLRQLRAAQARAEEHNRLQFEASRRHFDVVAESLRDDFRIFADAIARQTERLDDHEGRLSRLEARTS